MRFFYQIQIQGHLTDDWSDWFASLRMTRLADGTTLLLIPADQATLHGVLARIRDLNLTLISVNQVREEVNTQQRE
jgi:hypothetical protein